MSYQGKIYPVLKYRFVCNGSTKQKKNNDRFELVTHILPSALLTRRRVARAASPTSRAILPVILYRSGVALKSGIPLNQGKYRQKFIAKIKINVKNYPRAGLYARSLKIMRD